MVVSILNNIVILSEIWFFVFVLLVNISGSILSINDNVVISIVLKCNLVVFNVVLNIVFFVVCFFIVNLIIKMVVLVERLISSINFICV